MTYELIDFHRNVSDEELIADIRRVAAGNKSVTTREYNAKGKFHSSTIMARFGGWTTACSKAELQMAISRNVPNEELFRNLEEVWALLGRQPRHREMVKPCSRYSKATYAERFGSWLNALKAFVEFVNDEINLSLGIYDPKSSSELAVRPLGTRNINWRLRFVVMRRDHFKCKVCGRSPATDPTITLDVDHIKAWSKGGPTVLENLQTLCTQCNIGKSDLDFVNGTISEVQNAEA